MREALVSVVVPARNAGATIAAQLLALARQQTPPSEVIVVDDASEDATAEVARAAWGAAPSLRVIRLPRSAGAARARNVGVAASAGQIICLCDADDVVDDAWATHLASRARSGGIVLGRLRMDTLNTESVMLANGYSAIRDPDIALSYLLAGPSANMAFTRETFDELGGFDERFVGASAEDIDICWRAQLAAIPVVRERRAVVHYRLRSHALALFRQSQSYGFGDVQLYARYRSRGMPRPGFRIRSDAGAIARAAVAPDDLAHSDARLIGARVAGYRYGRLVGRLASRTSCR